MKLICKTGKFFSYPTIFSSALTPAINNDRSLIYNIVNLYCYTNLYIQIHIFLCTFKA